MSETKHTPEELRKLVDQAGIQRLVGIEPTPLPTLTAELRAAVQSKGLGVLQTSGLVHLQTHGVPADEALPQMWQAMNQPQVVVRTERVAPAHAPGDSSHVTVFWYFVNSDTVVQLAGNAPGSYRLALLSSINDMMTTIQASLPVTDSPPAAHFTADLSLDDVQDVWGLRGWRETEPAMEILRSDGLPVEYARQFFSYLVAPDWSGTVTFIGFRGGERGGQTGIYLLQGGHTGWMAYPATDSDAALRLETIMEDAFADLLRDQFYEVKAGLR